MFGVVSSHRAQIAAKHGILILSQAEALAYFPPQGATLIRIAGENPTGFSRLLPLEQGQEQVYREITVFHFDDRTHKKSKGTVLITPAQAAAIVDVFERHAASGGGLFVVHCQGGVSRSAAVGCAYALWRGTPAAEEAIRACRRFDPNTLVFEMVMSEVRRRRRIQDQDR